LVDILDATVELEPGVGEKPFHAAVFFPGPLPIDQQSESVFEAELRHTGHLELLFEGLGHGVELHGLELFDGLFIEHGDPPLAGSSFCRGRFRDGRVRIQRRLKEKGLLARAAAILAIGLTGMMSPKLTAVRTVKLKHLKFV
jgi:hypothetical protein